MPHIIANPFTLTEFLLDSLPPEERAGILVHPKRRDQEGWRLAAEGAGRLVPFSPAGVSALPLLRIPAGACKPFRRKRRC